MSLRIRAAIGIGIAGLIFIEQSLAHHSYAQFDLCTEVTIVGEIESIEWANPHIVLMVNTDDGNNYRVEWFALGQLSRAHLEPDVLVAGDAVAISGFLHRDPAIKLLSALRNIRRTSDDWQWRRQQRPRPDGEVRVRPEICAD